MLAQRLKELRASTPYTQAQTADAIGVARTTYAMYEQGKREPDNETLNKIADYYKVSTDYLLGRNNKPLPYTNKKIEDPEFEAFANNPTLQKWYKELPKSKEEDLEKLRKMWEIIKNDGN